MRQITTYSHIITTVGRSYELDEEQAWMPVLSRQGIGARFTPDPLLSDRQHQQSHSESLRHSGFRLLAVWAHMFTKCM